MENIDDKIGMAIVGAIGLVVLIIYFFFNDMDDGNSFA